MSSVRRLCDGRLAEVVRGKKWGDGLVEEELRGNERGMTLR